MKTLLAYSLGLLGLLSLTSCVDPLGEADVPNTDDYIITSPTSVGEVNTTIGEIKDTYCASSSNADFVRNTSNFYTKVNDDLVFEGVICANDVSGNLYQQLLVRHIDNEAGTDQSIILSLRTTALYLHFQIGQRIKVNLKGLYAGCYSKVPRIGQPYVTSYGNLNLGPALIDFARTNIELVGKPDPTCAECQPVDLANDAGDAWLRATANRTYKNSPMLATVRGKIKEVQGDAANTPEKGEITGEYETLPKTFGPEPLHDNGYGIDRTIMLQSNTSNVTVRTSTRNEISFTQLPADTRTFTGLLTYYTTWQIQLRDLKDLSDPIE